MNKPTSTISDAAGPAPRLQGGLNPEDKAVKVANYCLNLVHEVEVIAHSCGVPEPRRLKRFHVRIVQENGKSVPLDVLYPHPQPVELQDNTPQGTQEKDVPAQA